jgi:hypothetical protein
LNFAKSTPAPTLVTAASAAAASGPAGGYFIFDNAGANKGTVYCVDGHP